MEKIAAERGQLRFFEAQLARCAVERVADDGMFECGEVHTNLMRAAGMELDFDERGIGDGGEGTPIGACGAGIRHGGAVPSLALDSHARAMDGVATDGQLDAAGFFLELALHKSEVDFFHFALAKGFAELGVGGVVFGDENHAGSFFIQAVDDAGTQWIAGLRKRLAAAEERVDERAGNCAGAGMDGHAGGFVDGDDVVVFVENIERNRFGFGADGRAFGDFESDFFATVKMQRAFLRGVAIDLDEAGHDQFLDASAAELGALGSDEAVQTRAGIGGGSEEFAMRSGIGWRHGRIVARGGV